MSRGRKTTIQRKLNWDIILFSSGIGVELICLVLSFTFTYYSTLQKIILILLFILGFVLCFTKIRGTILVKNKWVHATGGAGILMVLLWFVLNIIKAIPFEGPLNNYTLFLRDSANSTINGLEGRISFPLGNKVEQEIIDGNGLVNFKQLPQELIRSSITLEIKSNGWIFSKTHAATMEFKFDNSASTIILEPDKNYFLLHGIVKDQKEAPVLNASITYFNISTITDSTGRFSLHLFPEKGSESQSIKIAKPGYLSIVKNISPGNSIEFNFYLIRQ